MAFGLMNSREEAEDIVQEVYVKLWGMRSELGNYNSIEALCIRITRNLCLDHLRRRKVNLDAMKAEQLKQNSFPETPSENLEKRENAELVHRLISALPEPQRSLVHLRHLEGKEYEEIAEMVNMNVNAIRVSISRARKQMREMIEKQYSSWRV
jgi:RNA polymerase sigma-70 factor (ECF subfamily)